MTDEMPPPPPWNAPASPPPPPPNDPWGQPGQPGTPPPSGTPGMPPPPGQPGVWGEPVPAWGAPPPPKRPSWRKWVVAGIALLAVLTVLAALGAVTRNKEEKRQQDAIDEATDRVIESLDEALARDPDVDNVDGSSPKPMSVSGGPSKASFVIDVPPGWEGRLVGKRSLGSSVEAFLNGPGSEDFAPNVLVEVSDATGGDDIDLDDLMDIAIRNNKRSLPSLQEKGARRALTVGGKPALAVDYSGDVGVQLDAALVVLLHEERAYLIYLSATPSQRPTVEPLFDAMLDSLQLR